MIETEGNAPITDVPRMSGALVLEQRRILGELCGKERFEAAIFIQLSPELHGEYEEVSPVSWPRVALAEQAMQIGARLLDRDAVELQEQVARIAHERTLTTLWRLLLRFTTDDALISRTPRIYKRALNRGEFVPRVVSPGRAEVKVLGFPDIPKFSVRGIRIGMESVLRLSGRQDVKVAIEPGAEGPLFVATWRV
jgi:hypothetical protein